MHRAKRCPFCGTVPSIRYDVADRAYAQCENGKCSNYFRLVQLESWNTRPVEDELQVKHEKLQAAALLLCISLRHWHDGTMEFDSSEHEALERLLHAPNAPHMQKAVEATAERTPFEQWLDAGEPVSGPQAYYWPSLRCINDALDDLRNHWFEMSNADRAQIIAQIEIITRHHDEMHGRE